MPEKFFYSTFARKTKAHQPPKNRVPQPADAQKKVM
jgi:hypothetical protein